MADDYLPLARVVKDLRRELLEAITEGEGEPLRFTLKPVELELKLAVTNEKSGEGGIKFWVVTLGGSASKSDAVTHTLKLTLDPVSSSGGPVLISTITAKRS